MKNKIAYILCFVVVVLLVIVAIMADFTNQLQHHIEKQDSLIAKRSLNDSVYTAKTKKYSEVITKYIYDCGISIDDKKISTSELVKIMNKAFKENSALIDSLVILRQSDRQYKAILKLAEGEIKNLEKEHYSFQDSAHLYKSLANLYEKDYGIKYSVIERSGSYLFVRSIGKADSALLLLPYYRNKLKKDSVGNKWTIMLERKATVREEPVKNASRDKKRKGK